MFDEVEALLEEIESVDTGEDDPTSPPDRTKRPAGAIAPPHDTEERDGSVEVRVTDDAMSVTATFTPSGGSGALITNAGVVEVLTAHGVVAGIDEAAVASAVWTCNTEGTAVAGVTVARGKAPDHGRSAHIALRQKLIYRRPQRPGDDSARVDHRAVSKFILVDEGDVLAKHIAERPGKPGFNVFGEALAFRTRKVRSPRPGKNVHDDGTYLRAAIQGRLCWDGRNFDVSPVLELKEDVDYHTGHIDFPGDVILHREVKDGFQIHADGSVVCMQTLDASDVTYGGDLIAHRGVIGRGEALISVGGRVMSKYIENCTIEAHGDVFVDAGIVNSAVFSLGVIRTGSRGVIVGGTMTALNGVHAAQVGTATGPVTTVKCGTDFEVARKLEWIGEKTRELALRLERVRSRGAGTPDAADLTGRIEQAQEKLQEAHIDLMQRLDPNEEATITIAGTVYPESYLEICHVPCKLAREHRNAVFSLNKKRGVVEPASR